MHPAYSVIFFTTSSGAGYGLLFWLSVAHTVGFASDDRWFLFTAMALALILITAGLVSSTLHLGHPERAVGAFSQWRSSWLSREGVAAIATYLPSGLLALIWLAGIETGLTALLAILAAAGAIVTVYCTGMIYASLRTIRQWHKPTVPAIYLALAAFTGALLFSLLQGLFGQGGIGAALLALATLVISAGLKLHYWRTIDGDPGQYTAEMAIGLKGPVKPLDPPHTRPNFVMREMGYQVARKHAERLRQGVFIALFVIPLCLVVIAMISGGAAPFFGLAAIAAALGITMERWLFFAEAEHVSMIYYTAKQA